MSAAVPTTRDEVRTHQQRRLHALQVARLRASRLIVADGVLRIVPPVHCNRWLPGTKS